MSVTFCIFSSSCSVQQQITRSARQVISDSSLRTAHVGISIYEPATGKYWYNHQGDHYFVPASNTKIPTCYAAMKYLGDSLVGLRYSRRIDSTVVILPAADPTFLHPEFRHQPVYEFLKSAPEWLMWGNVDMDVTPLGNGWAWNDYNESYMAERSRFPLYGNLVVFYSQDDSIASSPPFFAQNRLTQC
ncbi:MAG: D-alanyl-D-alanine carboxypeptidase [Chitinophagaceae bacterium]